MWKIGVVAVIGFAIAPAQAGHYRVAPVACTDVGEYFPPYIYPAPNWGPFFAKHLYVSPVITCLPTGVPVVTSEHVVSAKY
jgi:hypothetical protein